MLPLVTGMLQGFQFSHILLVEGGWNPSVRKSYHCFWLQRKSSYCLDPVWVQFWSNFSVWTDQNGNGTLEGVPVFLWKRLLTVLHMGQYAAEAMLPYRFALVTSSSNLSEWLQFTRTCVIDKSESGFNYSFTLKCMIRNNSGSSF